MGPTGAPGGTWRLLREGWVFRLPQLLLNSRRSGCSAATRQFLPRPLWQPAGEDSYQSGTPSVEQPIMLEEEEEQALVMVDSGAIASASGQCATLECCPSEKFGVHPSVPQFCRCSAHPHPPLRCLSPPHWAPAAPPRFWLRSPYPGLSGAISLISSRSRALTIVGPSRPA